MSRWWVNLPSGPDDSGDGGVQVQLGDEAVGEAEEDLGALLGPQLQMVHRVHVRDGVHWGATGGKHTNNTFVIFAGSKEEEQTSYSSLFVVVLILNKHKRMK